MSEQSALEPVIAAAYAALNVASMTALATDGVHSCEAPTGCSRYVVVQSPTELPWNTLGKQGGDLTFQVVSTVTGPSDLPAYRMASQAKALLHRQALLVNGYQTVSCHWESNSATADAVDGVVYRSVVSIYRVKVSQA